MVPSSRGDSPCADPSLTSDRLRILEVVNPGQAVRICTPLFSISVRRTSRKPFKANFEAEYPVRPGIPRYPATDEIPIMEPLLFMISARQLLVAYKTPYELT